MSGAAVAIPLAIEALQLLVTLEANAPQAITLAASVTDMLRTGTVTPEAAADIRRQLDAVRSAIDAA